MYFPKKLRQSTLFACSEAKDIEGMIFTGEHDDKTRFWIAVQGVLLVSGLV